MGTILIVGILLFLLKSFRILQEENGLGTPIAMLLLLILVSTILLWLERHLEKRHIEGTIGYENIDLVKYIFAIFIVVLHFRPFLYSSNPLDLAFNNILTRICVPFFFLTTGFFVAKKELTNKAYISSYIKRMIPFYLVWSLLYFPIVIGTFIAFLPQIQTYLAHLHLSIAILLPLLPLLLPVIILIALCYTGVYYHLWYFPAVLLSLLVLKFWKQHFSVQSLFIISFILLLFGVTESYYGIFPTTVQKWLSYYYNIFFTTRNFLFFGLFYVVLGYKLGQKKDPYAKHIVTKLLLSILLLIAEGILLQTTTRLNSNILLACVPLLYYLFLFFLYCRPLCSSKWSHTFRDLSKYYYLIHPAILFFFIPPILQKSTNLSSSFFFLFLILLLTHLCSIGIITWKKRHPNSII